MESLFTKLGFIHGNLRVLTCMNTLSKTQHHGDLITFIVLSHTYEDYVLGAWAGFLVTMGQNPSVSKPNQLYVVSN